MIFKIRKIIALIGLLAVINTVNGQLVLPVVDSVPGEIRKVKNPERFAAKYTGKMQRKGYLLATLDTLVYGDTTKAYFFKGPKLDECEAVFYENGHVVSTYRSGNLTRIADYVSLYTHRLQSEGYPYARVELDTFYTAPCCFCYNVYKGKFYTYDSLVVRGNAVSQAYLQRLSGIVPGQPFDDNDLKTMSQKVKSLDFIVLKSEPVAEFHDRTVTVYVTMDKKKAGYIDVMAGIGNSGNKLTYNGEVNLRLVNLLKAGEQFTLNWRKPPDNMQSLHSSFDLPFVLGSPLGFDYDAMFLVKDSSEFHLNFTSSVKLYSGINNYVSLFYRKKVDYSVSGYLPSTDYTAGGFAFSYKRDNSGRLNLGVKFSLSAGNKVYNDTLSLLGYDANLKLISITGQRRFKLVLENQAGMIGGGSSTLTEAFFLGGQDDFRGFDAYSLRATAYDLLTVEPRYFFDGKSYFFIFIQSGLLQLSTQEQIQNSTTTAAGFGFSFETKQGNFFFTVAAAGQNSAIDLRNAKVHIGYKAVF